MISWIHSEAKVLVQGITGEQGLFHAQQCRAYGTKIVGGVTPGRGGQFCDGFSVFDTVREGLEKTGASVSMIFVPAEHAPDAICEAAEAGISLIVCITEGIPVQDMLAVKAFLGRTRARLLGPNCPGIIVPGCCKIGIMPGEIHRRGPVAVLSRSGTLTYEAVQQLSQKGLGQSVAMGLGGDPVHGTSFIDALEELREDAETQGVMMIGEIGGSEEEEAAEYIQKKFRKPVAAFVAGTTAPEGKRMGHAGAIISGDRGTAAAKIAALLNAGVEIAESPALMAEAMKRALARKHS